MTAESQHTSAPADGSWQSLGRFEPHSSRSGLSSGSGLDSYRRED
jgi:hypothetical protein